MKKGLGLIGITALAALSGSPAFAADLALKAPPLVASCIWCGWYIGANAGGVLTDDGGVQTTGTPVSHAPTFAPEANLAALLATNTAGSKQTGFIGGVQLGYNYQFNAAVIGLEADIQGIASKSSGSIAGTGVPVGFPTETMNSLTTVSKSLDYIGTVRGRFGVEMGPTVLFYGTGGLAYGGATASTNIAQSDTGILPGNVTAAYSGAGGTSGTRIGWTAGGGVEWMFARQWSAKAEYLFYDLGTATYAVGPLVANAPGFQSPTWVANGQSTVRFDGSIFRFGVNYHF